MQSLFSDEPSRLPFTFRRTLANTNILNLVMFMANQVNDDDLAGTCELKNSACRQTR